MYNEGKRVLITQYHTACSVCLESNLLCRVHAIMLKVALLSNDQKGWQ